jgi:pre-rRNA-processing protein TSR1
VLDPNAASSSGKGVSFALDEEEDDEELESTFVEKERKRWRAAREEEQFPDEVDTPMHMPARERFARYRGLKSFRTSPWDAYENLPSDYAKIFMFRDWRAVGRSVTRQEEGEDDAVQAGTRVTLVIRLPEDAVRPKTVAPMVAWALHKHEHKTSVAHCTVLRNTEFEDDVRSKDPLVLQIGPRRYHINPLFSVHTQANSGKGSNNVHKFERFLPKNAGSAPSMATAYLPVTFGTTVPTLFFRDSDEDELPAFVGSGVLHSCDPTRVIAKRIVLTGHPLRVHKRTATIRYLFFNPDDVAYFKPVQLKTKQGRTGYIRESLGTHGLLKAGFDGPLQQTDTVCLNLYKRVFPKVRRR